MSSRNTSKKTEKSSEAIHYFVYILRTNKNTLYVGQTNNLDKRMGEHKDKLGKGSKYIRAFDSFSIVYTELFPTRSTAMKREYALKQMTHAQKEKLIKNANL